MKKDKDMGIVRFLYRNAATLTIGGVFLFLSGIIYTMLCGMNCDHEKHVLHPDHEVAHKIDGKSIYHQVFGVKDRAFTYFVVLVLSGPQNKGRRNVIRSTWLSKKSKDVRHYFVVGVQKLTPEEVAHLNSEALEHKDLILLKSIEDNYKGLTQKVLESFMWLDAHVNFKYVLKCDDDSMAVVDTLLYELKLKRTKSLYWGFFVGNARVKYSGQWAETEWNLCDRYMPYARGGGYILSNDLVHYIASNSKYLKKFKSEDVSVGLWLAPLEIIRKHDVRFDTEYQSRGCHGDYIVTHKQDIEMMVEKWKNYQEIKKFCKQTERLVLSYNYNWHVPPSKCCIRNDSSIP